METRCLDDPPDFPMPLMSIMLFFCLKVIAKGPSHSPDHTVNGVVSLPGVPE